MEDRIRELVKELSREGVQSRYLDRLRSRTRTAAARDGLAAVQREIVGEIASSLGRAEDRINAALLSLDVLERRLDTLDDADAIEQCRLEFNRQRDVALLRRRDLQIQREALGFRHNAVLREQYPIPPAKRST